MQRPTRIVEMVVMWIGWSGAMKAVVVCWCKTPTGFLVVIPALDGALNLDEVPRFEPFSGYCFRKMKEN